jgi:phosphoribosylformylglycinamidine synthase
MIKRIYVQKKPGFDVESRELLKTFQQLLQITTLEGLKILNRYDISDISSADYEKVLKGILAEPNVDIIHEETVKLEEDEVKFGVEYLPGQYDQQADSAMQCIQIITQGEKPKVKVAKIYLLKGNLTASRIHTIQNYLINPVDSQQAHLNKPDTLDTKTVKPAKVEIYNKFIEYKKADLISFKNKEGFAMSDDDILFVQNYFTNNEKRNPSVTELKVIDTYWSDHCRHTTFLTKIDDISFEEGKISDITRDTFVDYLTTREKIYGKDTSRPVTLMDLAVINMKDGKYEGYLDNLDQSEEINACSIDIEVDIDGNKEPWLLMFKNETHNHPTEIEPFGGAATCLGGAIRDPLSGRSYVYQAMRLTGAADPRKPIEQTIKGKLPQRKITKEAMQGYSSYGNQIGLATGQVSEVYDDGYLAKRMEVGAVIAAAPKENVVRERPAENDVVLLVGGRTGRDGCGGATGSSKAHTEESITTAGAEVQKGNPVEERKIQRLFRNPEVAKMIKRCNDFGAGGVSVAIGELADSLEIYLDHVPKKYEGLDGTELAISESQERMAVVVSPENAEKFIKYGAEENLEVTEVARVTDSGRLRMHWQGDTILDLSREFLETNGAEQRVDIRVTNPEGGSYFDKESIGSFEEKWENNLSELGHAAQKGLVENFDSTIGAGTVLMPFGGINATTPIDGMVAKIPLTEGDTTTCSIMTYGFNPQIGKWSSYHGGMYAVIESLAKITALGGDYKEARLSFQEYFQRLEKDPVKWGKPFSALLGAYNIQKKLQIAAIGGKDSMSGSFEDIHVPPTLISFAVTTGETGEILSPELKSAGNRLVAITIPSDDSNIPDISKIKASYDYIKEINKSIISAKTVGDGGLSLALSKMAFGNGIGIALNEDIKENDWFKPLYGSIILEVADDFELTADHVDILELGTTNEIGTITYKDFTLELDILQEKWEEPLNGIFPEVKHSEGEIPDILYHNGEIIKPAISVAKPKVFIPVFPGTNCEYDSAKAFNKAGAEAQTLVFKNRSTKEIEESIEEMVKVINQSQMIMIPGGFSAGDQPDGSAKFITAVFRNPKITEAVMELLNNRDGLMLGICNGFQALIKLGLVPYGKIMNMDEHMPTLTHNLISRHVSCMVNTKIVSDKSPWLQGVKVGDVHTIPVSHGEGRFVASEEVIGELIKNGQIATQYVDLNGKPTYNGYFNPNGSVYAVEGITSEDGRVFGKMGHSERIGKGLYKNVHGEMDQKIFESGVKYFR